MAYKQNIDVTIIYAHNTRLKIITPVNKTEVRVHSEQMGMRECSRILCILKLFMCVGSYVGSCGNFSHTPDTSVKYFSRNILENMAMNKSSVGNNSCMMKSLVLKPLQKVWVYEHQASISDDIDTCAIYYMWYVSIVLLLVRKVYVLWNRPLLINVTQSFRMFHTFNDEIFII